MEIHYCPKY